MPVPQEILKLVERFDSQREAYQSGKYNEAQIRAEFIDPLFKALGWDIHNEQGYAEAYKDVIHEDAIKIGGATEAPDLCFRIGGTRKFFVECKKPSVNIKEDVHPAYQLRRYAWSARLPLSILTDFCELAVYDCRAKPNKTDSSATGRLMYFTSSQFAEKWDEFAAIFARESVLKGSFDKYAESARGRKGTASVDDAFLEEIERWRDMLAHNIALRNEKLSQRELNFSVQRIIDRIVFLRICEDRGVEPYGRLMTLRNGERAYARLCEFFQRADERYNSGLFHFQPEKDRPEAPDELTLNLKIDDKVLKDIIANLYYPESPYEFSVLPADILGQVYERFLGKVIRLTAGHQAKVEDKPEVRKAGGVYYTPTYIVDYIVKNTVGKLLEGKTPRQAAKLKILDPACGSGSFLLGAYQYLLNWHRDWYLNAQKVGSDRRADRDQKVAASLRTAAADHKRSPRLNFPIYQASIEDWRLTTDEKKRILLNNIYGVDIDSQAVEVTKLSLLLKVLEGESQETITKQFELFHQRALPDLGSNIKCGNSLIGPDFYKDRQGELFGEDEMYRINAFDWQAEFAEIFKVDGFVAVIGNPPYVVIGKDSDQLCVVEYLSRFPVAQYKMDLFHLFIQRGIDLLRKDGALGFITPNTWLTLQFTDKLRRYVLDNCTVSELVMFKQCVFPDADVHTALLFLRKGPVKPQHMVRIKNPFEVSSADEIEEVEVSQVPQAIWRNGEGFCFEMRMTGKAGLLAAKLIGQFPRLDSVARASLGCQAYNSSKHTPEQIADRVFHSPNRAGKEYLPELAGKDVSRYVITRTRGEWIKYGPWLHDYRTMDWLQGPRILIREISGKDPYRILACYVEETYCHYKTILNVNPSPATTFSMKYLTGLLNSRLMSFIYPFISNKMVAQSFPRLSVGDVKRLPIRSICATDEREKVRHDKMVILVDQMLDLHKKLAAAKTDHEWTLLERQISATDREIDPLVYDLYGLTEEEIKIVEGTLRHEKNI